MMKGESKLRTDDLHDHGVRVVYAPGVAQEESIREIEKYWWMIVSDLHCACDSLSGGSAGVWRD